MKDFTDIIAIIDRSGSMDTIREDSEGGFNAFVKEQAETPGEANISLYQFDDFYDTVYENKPVAEAPAFNLKPRGMTALLDAVGKTIKSRGEYYASLEENQRPARVVVVIITDGQENSSREYTLEQIKAMITEQTDTYKWNFIFLGANMDAIQAGAQMGISMANSMSYMASSAGTANSYSAITRVVSNYKSGASVSLDCFTDEDRSKSMGN